MSVFESAIDIVLEHEGGFVNSKNDRGGATKYGISLRYLKSLGALKYDLDHDGDVDADDIKKLSREDTIKIYEELWDKGRFCRIANQELATKAFDMSVNMGRSQAIKLLQRACKRVNPSAFLSIDGIMGDKTITAINTLPTQKLLSAFRSECADFYSMLVNKNPLLGVYEAGWLRRAYS